MKNKLVIGHEFRIYKKKCLDGSWITWDSPPTKNDKSKSIWPESLYERWIRTGHFLTEMSSANPSLADHPIIIATMKCQRKDPRFRKRAHVQQLRNLNVFELFVLKTFPESDQGKMFSVWRSAYVGDGAQERGKFV